MGVIATVGGTAITAATAASVAGGLAAVGGTAYEMSKGGPKTPNVPAVPPSANPASLANAATSGAMQNNKSKVAGAIGSGFDGTLSGSPLGQPAPNTAKSSLLG